MEFYDIIYKYRGDNLKVTIGISNRHVHLTDDDLKILFGENFKLEKARPINQPGQYASVSTVTLKGRKDVLKNVRVLGPTRPYTQIEISKTDAYKLGVNPPVRMSGDIKESSPITIIGPKGKLELKEGCIIADRHIHILPEQRKLYGLEGIDKVSVRLPGEKGGIIDNVYIRESESSYYEMHLDTDDANAHLLKNGDMAEILK